MTWTTAEYRAEAQRSEQSLQWGRAAVCWQRALDVYPEHLRRGALWEAESKLLIGHRNDALATAGESLEVLLDRYRDLIT
jgi:hypothetical protein